MLLLRNKWVRRIVIASLVLKPLLIFMVILGSIGAIAGGISGKVLFFLDDGESRYSFTLEDLVNNWIHEIEWKNPITGKTEKGLIPELQKQIEELGFTVPVGILYILVEVDGNLQEDEVRELSEILYPTDLEVEALNITTTITTTTEVSGDTTTNVQETSEQILKIKKIKTFQGISKVGYKFVESTNTTTTTENIQPTIPSEGSNDNSLPKWMQPPEDSPILNPEYVTKTITTTVKTPVVDSVTLIKDTSIIDNAMDYVRMEGEADREFLLAQAMAFDPSFRTPEDYYLPGRSPSEILPEGWIPKEGEFLWPVPNIHTVTSLFGQRFHPIYRAWKPHNGMDIGAATGTPVVASKPGTVILAQRLNKAGNTVVIQHDDGTQTRYLHLDKIYTRKKELVNYGTQIGTVGTTGNSTGAHLHFEILVNGKAVDPLPYFADTEEDKEGI